MDNLISSILAAIVFIAFVAGLAHSIGEPPFIAIVTIVIVLMSIDVVQSIKRGFEKKNGNGEQ